jgi:hypothetical protein
MKFLDAIAPGAHEIIAVLDDAPDSWGRSANGVRVMGPEKGVDEGGGAQLFPVGVRTSGGVAALCFRDQAERSAPARYCCHACLPGRIHDGERIAT